jgi:hypothetical protein
MVTACSLAWPTMRSSPRHDHPPVRKRTLLENLLVDIPASLHKCWSDEATAGVSFG